MAVRAALTGLVALAALTASMARTALGSRPAWRSPVQAAPAQSPGEERGPLPAADALPQLRPGVRIEGEITHSSLPVTTPTLDPGPYGTVRSASFRVVVPEPGDYHIDLRSHFFDSYLIARDERGELVSENDDGLISVHSRLVLTAQLEGTEYRLEACALHGAVGPFELTMRAGLPPELSPEERRAAELAEARAALRVAEDAGPDHPPSPLLLNNMTTLVQAGVPYATVRPLLDRALTLCESALGKDHPDIATSLNSVARLLYWKGDLVAARPLYERALAIRETALGRDHPFTSESLGNLALVLAAQGDYRTARRMQKRALAIAEATLGPDHPTTAVVLDNLASTLQKLGDRAAARPLYERALAIHEKAHGPDHARTSLSLNNLANFLMAERDHEAARPLLLRALAITEAKLGPDHPDTAVVLSNLGSVLRMGGDYEAASAFLDRALAVRTKSLGPDHAEVAKTLDGLANLHLHAGDAARAFDCALRVVAIEESQRRRLAWSLTEAEHIRFARKQWRNLLLCLSIATRHLQDPESLRHAYEAVLAWKGQVFRSMAISRSTALATVDPENRSRIDTLRSLQSELSREMFRRDVRDTAAHQETLAALRSRRGALELELNRSLGRPLESRSVRVADLAAALPDDSVAVDFLVHLVYVPAQGNGRWIPARLSAWLLRAGSTSLQHVDLGDAATIETVTRRYLGNLVATRGVRTVQRSTEPAPATDETDDNDVLRRLLWEPIADHMQGARRVFVSPDGFLGTLPLETLQLEDRSYLLEHHDFVYLESLSSLVDITAGRRDPGLDKASTAPSLLCVGGVDFRKAAQPERPSPVDALPANARPGDNRPDVRGGFLNRWYSLPATDGEARAIVEMHEEHFADGRRLLLGGDRATEERIKHEIPGYRVVHLATHGFFQPEGLPSMWTQVKDAGGEAQLEMLDEQQQIVGQMPGLLSGLVLAGANRSPAPERDDGLLTAEEISLLDLSGVDLVVLSACETALGKSEAGEGMLGLRRMFRQAGARSVISSLWSVKDESTSLLMQGFYDRLWMRGQGTQEALRGARLDMLKKNRIENDGEGLPSTWGAFVLDGAW